MSEFDSESKVDSISGERHVVPPSDLEIRLGLCCIVNCLREQSGIFCSRKPTLKTLNSAGGLAYLIRQVRSNVRDLITILKWNHRNGIKVFRISSDLLPHKSNLNAPYYSIDVVKDLLLEAGTIARETGQRLTFHPGQYNVVGTPYADKFQATIRDLDWQSNVLDIMECPLESVLVVHGGGLYGSKEKTIERWIRQYKELPARVRKRLVLENCERAFNIRDCLNISAQLKKEGYQLPIVFDTHHYECYRILHPESDFNIDYREYLGSILHTWSTIRPKFHVSEQKEGARIGAHSYLVSEIPPALLEIPEKFKIGVDIMIEAKGKEEALRVLTLSK